MTASGTWQMVMILMVVKGEIIGYVGKSLCDRGTKLRLQMGSVPAE